MKRMWSLKQLRDISSQQTNQILEEEKVLKEGVYPLDTDIEISNLPENLNCYYAHARISNGKLNIVLGFYLPNTQSLANTPAVAIGKVLLDSDTLAKIIPYLSNIIVTEIKFLATTGDISYANKPLIIRLFKADDGISISLANEAITASSSWTRDCRFEFNLTLD